jgi:hypothetical protein
MMNRIAGNREAAKAGVHKSASREGSGNTTVGVPSVIGLTGGNLGTDGRLVSLRWLRCRLHNAGGG